MGWLLGLFNKSTPNKDKSPEFQEGYRAFQNDIPLLNNAYRLSNKELAEDWETGWNYASKLRLGASNKASDLGFLGGTFSFFAGTVGVVAFFGCWIYAIATYGWFLGLAFGWIPSLMIATIAIALSPVLLLVLLLLLILIGGYFVIKSN